MKCLVLLLSLLCLVSAPNTSVAEVREFTKKDGQAIFGEIVSYDVKSDVVKIKTDQGKTVQTKASSFMDEDFIYIRDWDAVRLFSRNEKFRIYLNDAVSKNKWTKYRWLRNPGKQEPSHTHTTDFNKMTYELKFENQTGYDLENVEIKYCIYYEQERLDHFIEEKVTDLVVRPSIHTFAIVPDEMNKKFESNPVVLRRKEIQIGNRRHRYLEGEGRFMKSELIGMVFRASITTLSGQTAVREIRLPKGLSEEYAWIEPTPENTVWADDDLDEREDTVKPPTPFEEMGGSEGDEEE
jgi:hypothetical protein